MMADCLMNGISALKKKMSECYVLDLGLFQSSNKRAYFFLWVSVAWTLFLCVSLLFTTYFPHSLSFFSSSEKASIKAFIWEFILPQSQFEYVSACECVITNAYVYISVCRYLCLCVCEHVFKASSQIVLAGLGFSIYFIGICLCFYFHYYFVRTF